MENITQGVYSGPPSIQQRSFRDLPAPQSETSPAPSCLRTIIKPHQSEPPAYTNVPCLDSLTIIHHDTSPMIPYAPHHLSLQQPVAFHASTHTEYFIPTTPSSRPSCSDDEDNESVPLTHLLFSHPHDAPPAYSTVVRQSYRETPFQHTPRHPVIVDIDEEAGLEQLRADDVSFGVEQLVATAVVIALLLLAGLLLALLLLRRGGGGGGGAVIWARDSFEVGLRIF
ncbi:uncharacterized protein EKO05_0006946 [Ascochyta rabiei]|uniref:uncharacterized protein n=1 Tax=Didymella rabiei TaxID=5454 RepID=UPI002202E130|nr:uncharacterized protein EKO05_0006946 [Ascochyta rabiei]UPX16552.1 hypothetical protein EKO05_0006946 [Ascochyta rabiei]